MTNLGDGADQLLHDRYVQWDAAYVLGALPGSEQLEFEQHLSRCARCAAAVAEIAGIAPLLASASASVEQNNSGHHRAFTDEQRFRPGPVTLAGTDRRPVVAGAGRALPVARRRWGRGIAVGAALAVAALSIAALIGFSVLHRHANSQAISVPLAPLRDSGVHATVRLAAEPWGTRLDVSCSYDARGSSSGGAGWHGSPESYQLVVTDRAGTTAVAAAWSTGPGTTVWPVGSVSFDVDDIAKITVKTGQNVALLQATR